MIEFNLNQSVEVQLTERGRNILQENHDKLYFAFDNKYPYRPPVEDENGWSKWQLWCLMREFGDHVHIGFDPPFKTTIRLLDKE